jgi:hypothetical protein
MQGEMKFKHNLSLVWFLVRYVKYIIQHMSPELMLCMLNAASSTLFPMNFVQ